MPPPSYGGPKLPHALLSQVSGPRANNHGARRARNAPQSRKESRKLQRQQKKNVQVRQPRGKFVPSTLGFVRPQESDSEDESEENLPPSPPVAVPAKTNRAAPAPNTTKQKSILKHREGKSTGTEKKLRSNPAAEESLAPLDSKPSRKVQAKLDEDDAEIAALEKRLGIKKKGKLNKSFQDDGLDVLLDELDETMGYDEPKKGKRKNDEDSAWLEMKRRKVGNSAAEEIASGSEDEDEDEGEDDGSDEHGGELDMADSDEELDVEEDSLDVGEQLEDDEPDWDDDEEDEADDDDDQIDKGQPSKRVRENPYVAPTTTATASSQKYIPPSLRKPADGETEALARLRRQTQGLLNRLSEANILTILSDVEKLYQSNPRQHVTSTLQDLLIDLIRDRTTLNDTFIILHAAFIAGLYRTIGIDFGAQLVQRLVEQFDHYYNLESTAAAAATSQDAATTPPSTKEPLNLISLLAHLYNFHVLASPLIFDYLRHFLSSLTEQHTELLLRLVRSSGPALRHDDPAALKDIVLLLQHAVAAAPTAPSVRTRFMIDTITDLKNNKLKPGAGAASDMGAEHAARLRKILGALGGRASARASEPLRVSLADLRDTEKRGKWWLVGASWRGHDDAAAPSAPPPPTTTSSTPAPDSDPDTLTPSTPSLAALATSARMTTPARRAIFITLLSSTDAADAATRIRRLRLSQPQRPDVARVLLHCAGAEAAYNPYYARVARRVCAEDARRMGMAVQGAVGEFLGRVDAEEDGGGRGGVGGCGQCGAVLCGAACCWDGLDWGAQEPRPPHSTPTAKGLRRGPPRHPPDRARQTHRDITIPPRSGL